MTIRSDCRPVFADSLGISMKRSGVGKGRFQLICPIYLLLISRQYNVGLTYKVIGQSMSLIQAGTGGEYRPKHFSSSGMNLVFERQLGEAWRAAICCRGVEQMKIWLRRAREAFS